MKATIEREIAGLQQIVEGKSEKCLRCGVSKERAVAIWQNLPTMLCKNKKRHKWKLTKRERVDTELRILILRRGL